MKRDLEKARAFEQRGRGSLARDPEKGLKRGPWRRSDGREGMASMVERQTADVEVPLPPTKKKRSKGLGRSRKPQLPRALRPVARELRLAWVNEARAQPCAVCGARDGDELPDGGRVKVDGHHVLEKNVLRKLCDALGLTIRAGNALERLLVLWDRRNLMALCERCHGRHHSWTVRLTRAVVLAACPHLVEFAEELDVVWLIDRTYPPERT